MNFLRKWLKLDPKQQSSANESEQAPVSVRARSEPDGEHSNGFSLTWFENDQADSSVFDTGSLRIEKSEDKKAVFQKRPDREGDSSCNAEEDTGFDPYNTGRFDTKKT